MARFKFTKTALQALEAPPVGTRLTVYDTEVPKLALRMTHAKAQTFYIVKRAGSAMAWVKLGAFPEMTVERAREEAQKVLGAFASGANPAEAKRIFKAEPTVSEFFDEYETRHGAKKRAWAADEQRFRDYLKKPLGNYKLSEVSRAMISKALSDAEKGTAEKPGKSVATVRNIRALASSVFAKAIEWGYLEANPVQGVKVAGKKVSRDRFLMSDELPRFFVALEEEPNDTMRDFILLALLTGARRSNLCAMHWKEIDLDSCIWRIPRTKNDEPQTVTLCPEAVAILKTRKEATKNGFVFPGNGASGHIEEPKKAVMRVMKRAEIPYGRDVPNGVTLHDLRRTLGSWQARNGASLAVIGKSLNHKSLQATAIYARLDLDPVRQSVNTATSAMREAKAVTPETDGLQSSESDTA